MNLSQAVSPNEDPTGDSKCSYRGGFNKDFVDPDTELARSDPFLQYLVEREGEQKLFLSSLT